MIKNVKALKRRNDRVHARPEQIIHFKWYGEVPRHCAWPMLGTARVRSDVPFKLNSFRMGWE